MFWRKVKDLELPEVWGFVMERNCVSSDEKDQLCVDFLMIFEPNIEFSQEKWSQIHQEYVSQQIHNKVVSNTSLTTQHVTYLLVKKLHHSSSLSALIHTRAYLSAPKFLKFPSSPGFLLSHFFHNFNDSIIPILHIHIRGHLLHTLTQRSWHKKGLKTFPWTFSAFAFHCVVISFHVFWLKRSRGKKSVWLCSQTFRLGLMQINR